MNIFKLKSIKIQENILNEHKYLVENHIYLLTQPKYIKEKLYIDLGKKIKNMKYISHKK